MTARTETHRIVDVPLPAGVVLRVLFAPDPEMGDRLIISRGFGSDGEPFRRPHWAGDPLVLPASVLPALRAALEELGVEG